MMNGSFFPKQTTHKQQNYLNVHKLYKIISIWQKQNTTILSLTHGTYWREYGVMAYEKQLK